MKNICVITGAPCFGMYKVVHFLGKRGVALINLQGASRKKTEKEEDTVLRYTADDKTNIVLTREDISHCVLVLQPNRQNCWRRLRKQETGVKQTTGCRQKITRKVRPSGCAYFLGFLIAQAYAFATKPRRG